MVEISKMKYTGCCFNCLYTVEEKQIYGIKVDGEIKIQVCEDCLPKFIKDLNEEYSKIGSE